MTDKTMTKTHENARNTRTNGERTPAKRRSELQSVSTARRSSAERRAHRRNMTAESASELRIVSRKNADDINAHKRTLCVQKRRAAFFEARN
nr:MAG TPA: hypothetical protein [Bacteriophage sp.]